MSMSHWIQCNDRMPEPGTKVWFHAIDHEDGPGGVMHGEFEPADGWFPGFHTDDAIVSRHQVTHWMPFVAPLKPDTF
jgi:hypothetical protein